MRRTRMGIRELVRTFVVSSFEMSLLAGSDIFSEYKADVDMSYYSSDLSKIKLKLYARGFEENHVEEKFVLEELYSNGLYTRTFRNSLGSVVIYRESGIFREYIDELVKFVIYARLFPSQTDFIPNHSNVPILI